MLLVVARCGCCAPQLGEKDGTHENLLDKMKDDEERSTGSVEKAQATYLLVEQIKDLSNGKREWQERAELNESGLQRLKEELEAKLLEFDEKEADMMEELQKLRAAIDPMKLIGVQVRQTPTRWPQGA